MWNLILTMSVVFFPGVKLGVFSKMFVGGWKWWNLFFSLETKKTTFFAKLLKIQGDQGFPSQHPWL